MAGWAAETIQSTEKLESQMRVTAPSPPVVPLQERHLDELVDFLEADPVANLHLLALVDRGSLSQDARGTWTAVRHASGRLRAVLYMRRSLDGGAALSAVPVGEPAACTILGQRLRRRGGSRLLVGDRAACDATWIGMGKPWFRISYDQRLYVCTDIPEGPRLEVEPARPSDVADLVPMHARMLEEDLQVPRDQIDPLAQWAQLQRVVSVGRMFVVRSEDSLDPLKFCIDIGDPSQRGTQVGGTYVPDGYRGQGVATRAMRAICAMLLGERGVPYVTLHVHENNLPAVRCYEGSGFRPATAFRLMVR